MPTSSDPGEAAILVDGLGKQYRIGEKRARYKSFRDVIARAAMGPVRAARALAGRAPARTDRETIWALRNVSFRIGHGEVVGIIGRNGAGKSTLLKILSRITEPTTGRAEMRGRIGSLLEVGTGFHQELTGGENIYLNGAILGMRRREIERKFDEIVTFAGVERFVDTQVKHYSSGMYLRLAFSVAAHLDPEILLVDEVLAVGDAAFQRKCLEKMEDVGRRGRTVLFVSHNMPAIARLCGRTILLDEGGVVLDGPSHLVVGRYLSSDVGTTAEREWREPGKAPASRAARLRAVRVRGAEGEVTDTADIRKPVGIEMEFDVLEPGWVMSSSYDFFNEEGLLLFGSIETDPEWRSRPRPPGRYATTAWVPGNLLSEGTVIVNVELLTTHPLTRHFQERQVVAFHVVDSMDGDSARGDWGGEWSGAVRPMLAWATRYAASGGAESAPLSDRERHVP
ncbi:MAG: polysaccharide ABC transporter ATP-binding protein [Thermoanaerobaculia bacterium]